MDLMRIALILEIVLGIKASGVLLHNAYFLMPNLLVPLIWGSRGHGNDDRETEDMDLEGTTRPQRLEFP